MKNNTLTCFAIIFFTLLFVRNLLNANPEISPYVNIITEPRKITIGTPYRTMMQVLTHERCLNCHPSDNIPKRDDNGKAHYFGMARGKIDTGFEATKCATCHQEENNIYSGVPGAPHWALAPQSMAWEGLSNSEIAKAMLDKSKNGNRSHDDLIHHLTEDKLVLWAFDPGVDIEGKPRTKPPVSEEAYIMAVKEWFANGARIPGE